MQARLKTISATYHNHCFGRFTTQFETVRKVTSARQGAGSDKIKLN
jgi:hypothetical protein